jgi:hypothetical protein
MKPGAHEFIDRAANDLTVAARHYRQRKHRQIRLIVQASFLLVAASIVAIVVSQRGAQAGPVQIKVSGGMVHIAVLDAGAPADQVENLLTAAGIPLSIDLVPTGPSRVGRVVSLIGSGSQGSGPLSVSIPLGAHVTLEVGRVAATGEGYTAGTYAFLAGEPLACLGGKGADASALAARVPAGIAVQWRDARTAKQLPLSELAGYRVDSAVASSATDVVIYAAEGKGDKRADWCR